MNPPNLNPPRKDLRIFALFLLLPALLLFYKFDLRVVAYSLSALAVIGAILPAWIKPLHNLLVVLTYPIGYLLNSLLLALIYYLVLTPLALIKGRPIKLNFPPESKTNFSPLTKKELKSYYDPF